MFICCTRHVLCLSPQGCQNDNGAYRSIGAPDEASFKTDKGLVSIDYKGGNGGRLVECNSLGDHMFVLV